MSDVTAPRQPLPSGGTIVDPDGLEDFVATVLTSLEMPAENARIAARAMVDSDVRGQHTHGVWFLPRYVTGLRGGGIVASAEPRVVEETAATAVVDGEGGLGQLVAARAAEVAERKAREAGCATVLVR